jgi:hypothetical protein
MNEIIQWRDYNFSGQKLLFQLVNFASGQQETAQTVIFKIGFAVVSYRLPI